EFRSVFRAPSQNFKILAIPNIFAYRKLYEHNFGKNATTINSVQSRISIDFSCTVTVFQNTSHSQRISLWEVVRTQFH
ncbi:hypothetical protein BHE74_00024451, partial [Ensete ventricosum]